MEAEKYNYSPDDYILECCSWHNHRKNNALSKLDMRLRDKWDAAMAAGHFRYDLSHLRSRVVPGPEQYVIELNLKRGTQRRVPEKIESLNMPFNSDKFNFTKVKIDEVLFQLCPEEVNGAGCKRENVKKDTDLESLVSRSHSTACNGDVITNGFMMGAVKEDRHLMLINVSPLGYGHTLVVCNVDDKIYQRMSLKSHKMAIEMALLSNHPGFRVGFNSLCALASVNHQHFHTWYMEEQLTIETASARQICNGLYEMTGKPTRALVLQVHGNTVDKIAKIAFTITDFYQESNVAHNIFITRGSVIGLEGGGLTVRVYIWPRKNVFAKMFGEKNECGNTIFNVAVAELAGFVPMYVADAFEAIEEKEITDIIQSALLPDAEFERLRDSIVSKLQSSS